MNREIKISVKENSYKVSFPNVGQFLNIEALKATLSDGLYGAMQASRTIDSGFALDVVDMEAYFTVLCPDLVKDLNVKSFRELDIVDVIELRTVFVDQMLPFIKQWRDIIAKIGQVNKDSDEK